MLLTQNDIQIIIALLNKMNYSLEDSKKVLTIIDKLENLDLSALQSVKTSKNN